MIILDVNQLQIRKRKPTIKDFFKIEKMIDKVKDSNNIVKRYSYKIN